MNMIGIVCLWVMFGSLSAVDPVYPQNTVSGGTVVAELGFVSGEVERIKILYGGEPFTGSCRTALTQWHADSGLTGDEIVVVHFRQPYLYAVGDTKEFINLKMTKRELPYPVSIIHPSYPPNAVGQGSVILRVDISDKGAVSNVHVIRSMGVLTEASVEAVRKWSFTSAVDEDGKETPSHAFAVLVFHFPNLAPKK